MIIFHWWLCVFATAHLKNRVLPRQFYLFWTKFVGIFFLTIILSLWKRSPRKNATYLFNRKIRHFPDLPVIQDLKPQVLPKPYKKISIVTKWSIFVTKIRWRWVPWSYRLSAFPTRRMKNIWIFIQWMLVHFIRHYFVFGSVNGMIISTDAHA